VIYLEEKKNKAGESIIRVKSIFRLINKNDSYGLDYLPKVQSFSIGLKDIEFFLNNSFRAPSSSLID